MAEEFVRAAPIVVPQKVTATYRVVFVGLWTERRQIAVQLRGENGELEEHVIGGEGAPALERDQALSLMQSLNTANLSTNSLNRRLLTWLITNGRIAGTIV